MNRITRLLAAVTATLTLTMTLSACDTPVAGNPLPFDQTGTATPPPATVTVTETPKPQPASPPTTITTTESAPPPVTTIETTSQAPPPPVTSETVPAPGPQTDAEIRTETGEAFDVVNTYWINLFDSWHGENNEPIQWWTPTRYHGDGFYDSSQGLLAACSGDFDTALNAFFCPNNIGSGFVAWDMALFRLEALFDDGPLYVVAHEVAHAAQARFWFDNESGATPPPDSIAYELQADCIAGATLAKAEQDGYLTIEPGDVDEIIDSTRYFNERGGDHGSAEQRIAAFTRGFQGDIESCLYNRGEPPT